MGVAERVVDGGADQRPHGLRALRDPLAGGQRAASQQVREPQRPQRLADRAHRPPGAPARRRRAARPGRRGRRRPPRRPQRLADRARIGRLVRPRGSAGPPGRFGAGGVGRLAERQRHPAGRAGDRGAARVAAQAAAGQQGHRLEGRQRPERERGAQRLPALLEPAVVGASATRQHHDGRLGQGRKQLAAQREHARGRPVDAIEEHERARGVPCAGERLAQRRGGGADHAAVGGERRPAGAPAATLDLAQQRALADPRRAVDEQHARPALVAEQRVDDAQLRLPPDECGAVAACDVLRQRGGGRDGVGESGHRGVPPGGSCSWDEPP